MLPIALKIALSNSLEVFSRIFFFKNSWQVVECGSVFSWWLSKQLLENFRGASVELPFVAE